jgi:hypothetical protein
LSVFLFYVFSERSAEGCCAAKSCFFIK